MPAAAGLLTAFVLITASLGAIDRDVLSFRGWAGGDRDGTPTLVLPRPDASAPARGAAALSTPQVALLPAADSAPSGSVSVPAVVDGPAPAATPSRPSTGSPTSGTGERKGQETDGSTGASGEAVPVVVDPVVTRDSDGDGISDAEERRLGTNPRSTDSDGDALPDAWEIANGLDPLSAADARTDQDRDGVRSLTEFKVRLNPQAWDTNGDGRGDGDDDTDGDGVPNAVEERLVSTRASRTRTVTASATARMITTATACRRLSSSASTSRRTCLTPAGNGVSDGDTDSDGDGLPNAMELTLGLNRAHLSTGGQFSDGDLDSDGDGIPNALEILRGTDPAAADTPPPVEEQPPPDAAPVAPAPIDGGSEGEPAGGPAAPQPTDEPAP